jgi:hypothetical protein
VAGSQVMRSRHDTGQASRVNGFVLLLTTAGFTPA